MGAREVLHASYVREPRLHGDDNSRTHVCDGKSDVESGVVPAAMFLQKPLHGGCVDASGPVLDSATHVEHDAKNSRGARKRAARTRRAVDTCVAGVVASGGFNCPDAVAEVVRVAPGLGGT
jgi:hypothetical protein